MGAEKSKDASEVAKLLSQIQAKLREKLLSDLEGNKEELGDLFDPDLYSPAFEEYRERYLSRLYVLQSLLQELANFNQQGGKKRHTKVASVSARNHSELAKMVNRKIVQLNGCKVTDVKFVPTKDDKEWVAVITYLSNPFVAETGETAAWM
jgi:hypothetical protein